MKVTISAPAKLNLFLEITGQRSDGYHLLDTVMQSVSLYDDITVSEEDDQSDITVQCSDKLIPCDETNTAYRAAVLFFEHNNMQPRGLHIHIKKRIPAQAGMGGGSADAAAVLLAMNELYDTDLDRAELARIAEKIGADVPFCVYNGTMSAGGIGTILTPLPDMPACSIVIVKPDVMISTKDAYTKADHIGYSHTKSSDSIVESICAGLTADIGRKLFNRFEQISDVPELDSIKTVMKNHKAAGACMTGSGSAVFGIFESSEDADDCADELSKHFDKVYTVNPVN